MAVKTWVWVVVGVVAMLTIGCFAIVGTGVYIAAQNVHVEEADETTANRRFEDALERLPNRTPLFVIEDGVHVRRTERDAMVETEKGGQAGQVQALRLLAWDPKDRRVVEFRVPFWLFRLTGSVDVGSDGAFDFNQLKLTPEEVARRGPSLIFEHRNPRGERVMLWAE